MPFFRAPVAVFAFKRLDLLKKTLAAAARSNGFTETPIHIFSDGPNADSPSDSREVAALREWANKWSANHGAIVHEAITNQGLRRSIVGGVTEVLSSCDRVVVLEEDIIVSRWFLEFMNDALEALKERPDIFQVSGYFVPTARRLPDTGLLRVPGSWGWGTWRRAWQWYRDDVAALLEEVRHSDPAAFDFGGAYSHLDALERNANGTLDTWLVRWYASIFLRNGLCVYPGKSLTRNIGFDARATNTSPSRTSSTLLRQRVAGQRIRVSVEIGAEETPEFVAALEDFYRWQLHQWKRPSLSERARARLNAIVSRRI